MIKKKVVLVLVLPFVLLACKKEAGTGGNSSISGKVQKEIRVILNNPATIQNVLPASDQEVYIVFGDHLSPDDKVQTNYNGEFEFLYLRPGKYKVYTFSDDTNSVAVNWDEKHMAILRELEITDKKQEVTASDMMIYAQN